MHPLLRYVLLLLLAAPHSVRAQENVCERAHITDAYLDVNNVRARVFNDGGLFWKGNPYVYEVPKGGGVGSVFTANFVVGGIVEGEIRTAAATYGPWEFWPGPLDEDGRPPADCAPYDRIWEITAADVRQYEETGFVSPNLRDWPHHLGAPVIDGDGTPGNYNLAAGDRPEVLGHQTLWWVMNDAAGEHRRTGTPAIEMEVRASAFAAQSNQSAINDATLYRYRLTYRGDVPFDSAYVGLFADPDLGYFGDDYMGSDSLLGIGYVYNADNIDEGGYGAAPPAWGFDFVQGPPADANGRDDDYDGTTDEPGERLGMTAFAARFGGAGVYDDPTDGRSFYTYMQGLWRDGRPFTVGGDGRSLSGEPTTFMFSGDPVTRSFWTELNSDGDGTALQPWDEKFVISSGPFSMQPGETVEVVVAALWARGDDHLDSVAELRAASRTVQAAWENGFRSVGAYFAARPAGAPTLLMPGDDARAQPANATLRWTPVPGATSYLVDYAATPAFDRAGPHLRTVEVEGETTLRLNLETDARTYWRVLPANDGGYGAWSDVRTFTTGDAAFEYLRTGFTGFLTTANAAGPLDPPTGAASAEAGFPVPEPPGERQQVGEGVWVIHRYSSATGNYDTFTHDLNHRWADIVPYDYEMRFTARGGKAYSGAGGDGSPGPGLVDVPFELWRTGIDTPDDPSDDVRMIPFLYNLDQSEDGAFNLFTAVTDGAWPRADHPVSPGDDDPMTDPFSWVLPLDDTPGDRGYEAWVEDFEAVLAAGGDHHDVRALSRADRIGLHATVLVNMDGGDVRQGVYNQALPETGSVFRITTAKPAVPLPAAPADGALAGSGPVVLGWHGTATRLQVARDPAFADLVLDRANLPAVSSYALPDLGASSTYHWRVGTSLGWSDAWRFTTARTTASEPGGALPERLTIDGAYPNPFAASTTLRIGVPAAGDVRVAVYDVLGRRVALLADGPRSSGWHDVAWDAAGLASGVYLAEVTMPGGGRVVRAITRTR